MIRQKYIRAPARGRGRWGPIRQPVPVKILCLAGITLMLGVFFAGASPGTGWGQSPPPALKPRKAVQWLDSARLTPTFGYRVVASYPHDPQAFTQGILFAGGRFYESTGLRGYSSVREVDPASGRVVRQRPLPAEFFGEGLALYQGRLYQLTWQGRTGFVYDRLNLDRLDTFQYPTQGWGLTHNGLYFIQSDGTDQIYFRTLDTFQLHHTVPVRDAGRPIARINELEFIHGRVWANIWHTQRLALIDPQTGRVDGWVDLTGLAARASDGRPGSVLNGIAHDAVNDRLWVTGKRWSLVFEIELVPPE